MASEWRKSSRSNNGTDCIEIAGTLDRLRDSKNPNGPILHANIAALIDALKNPPTTPGV
jgi:hypothetical protein